MQEYLWLIPALPLLGAILCGLLHAQAIKTGARSTHDRLAPIHRLTAYVACLSVFASLVVAFFAFRSLSALPEEERAVGLVNVVYTWLPGASGFPTVDLGFQFDPWAAVLALVVTGVGFLIHVYATGYMRGDDGYARFFAYTNLFVFAMLLLVMGSSLPLMFIGWEGVGLCSYLLIGFWYTAGEEKGHPADSGRKAFLVNRIGDLGFLLGMFLLALEVGTFSFAGIREALAGATGSNTLTLAAILLFLGACGKSAQLPLYVWLPDAMAGPTPVSALIHAATMVTAGVFMIGRLDVLYALAPTASTVVAVVGVLTALYAGTMALVARDIKKVLAYSTISQLGYMFLAVGVGAMSAGMFHLTTHAFFKALLFLAAGNVIHAVHDEQDIFKMGGLRKVLPRTFPVFLIGALALAGLPGLSGFFSKDEILWKAIEPGTAFGVTLWALGSLTALLTAFYTFRLVYLVFFGEPRYDRHHVHPHEAPGTMTWPLMGLATGTILTALLGIPGVLHPLAHFLEPSLSTGVTIRAHGHEHGLAHAFEFVFLGVGAVIAIAGVIFARRYYGDGQLSRADAVARRYPGLYKLLLDKYRVDEFYHRVIVAPLTGLAILCGAFDLFVIDGIVNAFAHASNALGRTVRRIQTGHLQSYAMWVGGGTFVLVLTYFILSR